MVKKVKQEELQKTLESLEDQLKRSVADYQNLEKRITAERQEWIMSANKRLILDILPILDTLILVQKHNHDQGLALNIQQFLDILTKEGVKKIEVVAKDFDPQVMECIQTVEGQEGKVIEEIKPGYMLYNKLLRPAHVKVGKSVSKE